jgi:hypothetical protein
MSWNFSQALEVEFSPRNCLDIELSAQSRAIPIASDDSCSDRMKGTFHRSPFGTMFAPSTDIHGAALLTAYLAAFPAKPIPRQLEEKTLRTISGRKCDGSWQMSLPGTYAPRTSSDVQSTGPQKISRRWVTKPEHLPFPRQTWVLTTFGNDTGYLHTPTATANYAAPSMQKWAVCREYVRIFGRPTPVNHEWLMAWPIGWTDSKPLETDKFQSWLRQHSPSCLAETEAA